MTMKTILAAALLARFTVLVPHENMLDELEAGYRRHLEWHRTAGDRWTWHGWTIITGDRLGTFIDATIDRTPEEIDAPVKPLEDRADNQRNVFPYVRSATSSMYRARPDLCSAAESSIDAPFSTMATVHVHPGRQSAFEEHLKKNRTQAVCFELLSGGAQPSYLFLLPAQKFSAALTTGLKLDHPSVASIVRELLRYRPDLTYVPAPR